MFPSIDNLNVINTMKSLLDNRLIKYVPQSAFGNDDLLQKNGTATGAPNARSYADIAMSSINNSIFW